MGILPNIFESWASKIKERRRRRKVYEQAQTDAKIIVGVLHNWLWDFDKALKFLTPGGRARVGEIAFVPYKSTKRRDFVLVLNTPIERRITVKIAPERLWFGSGEPPGAVFAPYQEGQGPASTVVMPDVSMPAERNGRSYIAAPPVLRTWMVERNIDDLLAMKDVTKSKALSWVTSNKSDLEGHKKRLNFLEKLKREVPFDLYGNGFQRLADKWDGIAPYRYSIAFENTIAPLYFTEKLMDCFVCHTLPLYYGAPDILKHFPAKSMALIDPDDPAIFQRIRDITTSDLWRERLPFILEAKELVLKKYNSFNRLATWLEEASKIPASPSQAIALRHEKARPH